MAAKSGGAGHGMRPAKQGQGQGGSRQIPKRVVPAHDPAPPAKSTRKMPVRTDSKS